MKAPKQKRPVILFIEPSRTSKSTLQKLSSELGYKALFTTTAQQALMLLNEEQVDAVITELSLSGHSGFEFIYEFRSYADWLDIPLFIYSSVELQDAVLKSQAWKELRINAYLYKPNYRYDQLLELVTIAVEYKNHETYKN